jgi:hypothetical protein
MDRAVRLARCLFLLAELARGTGVVLSFVGCPAFLLSGGDAGSGFGAHMTALPPAIYYPGFNAGAIAGLREQIPHLLQPLNFLI